MKKLKALLLGVVVLMAASLIANGLLLASNRNLKDTLATVEAALQKKMNQELISQRQDIKQDLEEKYRADQVSYKALYERSKGLRDEVAELKEELAEKEKEIESLNKKLRRRR